MTESIDITFDLRRDTPSGKDPDTHSPTLRRYHRMLWSKPLPNGRHFHLVDTKPEVYLHHKSDMGEFRLGSDAVIPSFAREQTIRHVIEQIPEEKLEFFNAVGYTIGGMMLWPSQRVGRKMTINQRRGLHPRIKDRFDLTLECVKRHYDASPSPMSDTLNRHEKFFSLFGDFKGFVEHFLLQDIVTSSFDGVCMFIPFNGFDVSPLPQTPTEYNAYMTESINFIEARNRRISRYWQLKGT
ncbi:DUF6994 family protein [Halofilum ochraceum]|uniref:DUF6994 family protein n=1 Tax=Halofilum ochraceum TaxID=1611323 RepID=UPI0008DAF267|nr:hypothetical protein [Halofilum ochraceum]